MSPSPTRVLINGLHAKAGGGVTYLRNVAPLLAADPGLDPHLCLHAGQPMPWDDPPPGLTVHRLDFRTGFWRLLAAEQRAVPALARKIGATVTFSPANYGPVFAPGGVLLLRNALGVAAVERRPAKMAYWALLFLATAASLATCARAIAVSDYARRTLGGGALAFARNKVTVVPHGVGRPFGPDPAVAREDFLLAVSDLYVQKNLHTLLDALARVPDARLLVAGSAVDADYKARLDRQVAAGGLGDRVTFLGPVAADALADLYRRCRLFVFPSTVETFGNPLVEAMACGCPIAASDATAMPEVLGGAGALFDPHDAADMARVINGLWEDDDARAALSAQALARAGDFSWARTAAATAEVLKGV